ncbi:hypothetical protein BSLA_02r0523 [Burkholderia stabilis]|nr:hypothetical protein BSLA_02r0523 [Burkholderia stabilis]
MHGLSPWKCRVSNRLRSLPRAAHRAPAAHRRGEAGMAPNRGRMM